MRILIFITIIFITLIISPGLSGAQARTITISPPTTSYKANPGQILEGVVKIRNDSTEELTFISSLDDFIVEDSKGTPKSIPPNTLTNRYLLSSWITLKPKTFTLKPKEVQEVVYSISIPFDAVAGGHYAMLLFSPINRLALKDSGTEVQSNIGSLLLITVLGDIHEKAQLTRFFANTFQEYGPILVSMTIRNNGDVHIQPKGEITISDMLGQTLERQPIDTHNIFPQAVWDYQNILGKKWMIGRFKIDINASYGSKNQLLQGRTLYVWIIPWQILLLFVLSITTLILLIVYIKRRKLISDKPPVV